MRRKEFEVTDRDRIRRVLEHCVIVHLGLVDDGVPYVVSMNFALDMDDEHCIFYFHSAKEGRKIDIMRRNPLVCVEASLYRPDRKITQTERQLHYQSVIGTGTAIFVDDPEEKARALTRMSRWRGDTRERHHPPEVLERVCVFKVVMNELSCKEH